MQGLGGEFLARAAFAGDQNVHHAIADALHQTHDLLDARSGADDALAGITVLDLAPEVGVLLRQLVLVATPLADQNVHHAIADALHQTHDLLDARSGADDA